MFYDIFYMWGSCEKLTIRLKNYSKNPVIQDDWKRTLVQATESPNGSVTESMFKKAIKWIPRVISSNRT